MEIGSSLLPSDGREGLNLDVCDRLGGREFVADGPTWLDGSAVVEVGANGPERGGMV